MPIGVYKHQGHPITAETRRKIGEANKVANLGKTPWNKGLKGYRAGIKHDWMPSGEKHWSWKGGISTEDKRERMKFRNKLQKLIFERDGYKCQICDSNKDLQIDHIQSWAEFKELRFDPENCRTLCAKCHYKITFGREMPETTKAWGHNLRRVATL